MKGLQAAMKKTDEIKIVRKLFEKETQFNRREFLKTATAVFSGLAVGKAGCSASRDESGWKDVSFPKVLFHNFRLFNGKDNLLSENQILLVEGDKIKGIERMGNLAVYRDYKLIDLKGQTVLPGLIDNHTHVTSPLMDPNLNMVLQYFGQVKLNYKSCVMSGVTTVRDVGAFPGMIDRLSEKVDRNEIPGPRVISSLSMIAARKGNKFGMPDYIPYFFDPFSEFFFGGNFAQRPSNPDEIRDVCEELISRGTAWLKTLHHDQTCTYYPREVPNHSDEGYKVILELGRKHGIRCAMHMMFLTGFKKGVELGYHTLEHMPINGVVPQREIEKFVVKGMAIIPTIMIHGDCFNEDKILDLITRRGKEYLMPEARRQITSKIECRKEQANKEQSEEEIRKLSYQVKYEKDMFHNTIANLKNLKKMGATVGMGTDSGGTKVGFFGRFTDEMRHYVSAGISNFDVLCIATSVNARIIDMHDKIGTIEKGRLADIIAVKGNPLENIDAMDNVCMVVKGGHFIRADGIDLGPG